MRILIVTNLYPDAKQPTFGTFIANRVKALAGAGAVVRVVSIQGVPVHQRVGRKYLGLAARALWAALRALQRRRPPHIVEAHLAYPTGLIAWPVARMTGAKLVLFCHGSDVHEVGMRSPWHHRLALFAFRRADLLVANSAFTRATLLDRYGIAPECVVEWSPGIDRQLFGGIPDGPRNPRQVLFVGRLDPQKGADVLIQAVSRLPDLALSLRVIGDGPARAALEAHAASLGAEVLFEGALPPEGVAHAMAEAGVLAVPSVRPEGLGLVALEGMAAGALVVASTSGGLAESVIPGTNGWLVPPGDPVKLADAIREAVVVGLDPSGDHAIAIRKAAAESAAQHDLDMLAGASLQRYRELTDGR